MILKVNDRLVFHQPDMCAKFGPSVTIDRVQGHWAWSGLWGFNERHLVEHWLPNGYVHIEHAPTAPTPFAHMIMLADAQCWHDLLTKLHAAPSRATELPGCEPWLRVVDYEVFADASGTYCKVRLTEHPFASSQYTRTYVLRRPEQESH